MFKRFFEKYLLKKILKKIALNVLLNETFEQNEIKNETLTSGCNSLYKHKVLNYLFLKIRRELMMKLTQTDRTNITEQEDAFYRGGLYVIRKLERIIALGAKDDTIQKELDEYLK